MSDPAFALRVRLHNGHTTSYAMIYAYDDLRPQWDEAGRIRLAVEVREGGKIIFPKGQLYCALHGSSDGIRARELVLSLVAMKPGDTDADYFADYTPEQLEWAEAHSDDISMVRESRYCDENGNPRKDR